MIQLAFLNAFDAFCKEHKLGYWLDFGTLLGAARNSKFIPWDDDVDVCMLRKDFDVILDHEGIQNGFSAGYYFKHHPEIGLIKIYNKFLPEYIGMDIFVSDLIDNYLTVEEKLSLTRTLNSDQIFKDELMTSKRLTYFSRKLCELGLNFSENLADAKTIVYGLEFYHVTHPSIFMDKEDLFPLSTIHFEGREYPCPKNVDRHLILLYGNYKTPNWKQLPHTLISKLPIEDLIKISQFLERQ